jgi:hypothetical protein
MKTESILTEDLQDVLKDRMVFINEEHNDEGLWTIMTFLKILQEQKMPIFTMWISDDSHNVPSILGADQQRLFFPRRPMNENQVRRIAFETYWNDFGRDFFEVYDYTLPHGVVHEDFDELPNDKFKEEVAKYIQVRNLS